MIVNAVIIMIYQQANTAGDRPAKELKGGVVAAVEKKKKESIVDLSKYLDKAVRVKFQGGREAQGILKGYDPLLNLVLDNTTEFLRGKFFVSCRTLICS